MLWASSTPSCSAAATLVSLHLVPIAEQLCICHIISRSHSNSSLEKMSALGFQSLAPCLHIYSLNSHSHFLSLCSSQSAIRHSPISGTLLSCTSCLEQPDMHMAHFLRFCETSPECYLAGEGFLTTLPHVLLYLEVSILLYSFIFLQNFWPPNMLYIWIICSLFISPRICQKSRNLPGLLAAVQVLINEQVLLSQSPSEHSLFM